MAIREADEPIHRRSQQSAHEQLASHRVSTPNQHHLCIEGREVSLWVLYTREGGFGPHERGWYHGVHDRLREWHWKLLNQVCSSFEESKSFEFDGRLDVLVVVKVL